VPNPEQHPAGSDDPGDEVTRVVRAHALASLASDVLSQTLSTVLAGGLLYLVASVAGAITGSRQAALLLVAASLLPVAGFVLLQRIPGWRRTGRGGYCGCAVCRAAD
jgi:hypothetical protein